MKTSGYILILAAGLLIGLSNTTLARARVSVSTGSGHRGSRSSFRADYKLDSRRSYDRYRHYKSCWGRRKCRNRLRINILRSVYIYDWKLGYCVPIAPMVIEKQKVIVQSQQFDESTIELNKKLQYKKSELLKQLQAPDKEQRMEAIAELAGFSFDDKVRYALENILLSDPDPELRAEAAHSFGKVKNKQALTALEKARVEDVNEDVRKAANEAIKRIKGN